MPQMKSSKPKKPTQDQSGILARIARSRLIKTRLANKRVPVWVIDGDGEISHECATTLIRNGWLKPQRDGLSLFDESQTYLALTPGPQT